ncbi:DEAD/DEAH box helicase [Peribacillus acanthi]|uniref:DEAD/DEAH box helicase n=1 Tax=Peribacillus acanthi TaxID=2171554 RepID=UPI000D3EBFDF|nr:DEAD/DEAH box helicase [Peribacillus acanthi]
MFNHVLIKTTLAADGQYLISAFDRDHFPLQARKVFPQLFLWDQASYFGTQLQYDDQQNGVIVDAWGLLSLFSQEHFQSFIEWEWDEASFLCLSIAPVLAESMQNGLPTPDFSQLREGNIGWNLPEDVKEEFEPSFWGDSVDVGETISNTDFVQAWFNGAAESYLRKYSNHHDQWNKAMDALKNAQLAPEELHAYFTQDRWNKWLGFQEDERPFTTGLQIVEPADGEGPWTLEVVLQSKKDDTIVTLSQGMKKLPRGWKNYLETVDEDLAGWLELVPWLGENGALKDELTEAEAWEFLTEASEKLLFVGAEILLPSWWTAIRDSQIKLKAKVKSTSSRGPSYVGLHALMDFDWRFSMNGADLSEDEFNKLVQEKRRLVYIKGQWVKLDPAMIKQLQTMMKTADQKGIPLSEMFYQELLDEAPEEDDLEDDLLKIQFELNQDLKKLMSSLRETKSIPITEAPDSLHGSLRPYQTQGLSWLMYLRKHGFGACLADDMGLGKTVQVISYLLAVKETKETTGQPTLIICPTSVLGNWQKELEKFSPSLNVYLHYGSNRKKGEDFAPFIKKYDVVLTSFGMAHSDFEELGPIEWNSVILDEAQNIKNPGTKQSKAARKLKGRHHIALTGTPMENRLSELWAIFDFINKGYLGTLRQFQEKYVNSIEKDGKTEKIKELQKLIQPFLLRRTKKDEDVALNLPDKLEQKEYVPLTSEQASLYEQLIKDTFAEVEKLSAFERKGLILGMLTKLKQLCNHPALYLKEQKVLLARERSAKLDKLFELTDAVMEQNESCLIFTQYIGMGEMMQELLQQEYGIKVPFLNGSLPKKQRDEMIESFQNGLYPIFILSLKAGGTGLNLTAANHVVHFDRWWNPAVENQATDRAYRIGQKRFVHVHKLICTGTLEEKIDNMLEKKQALNDEIIQSDNWITELSTDEIKDLVSLS